MSQLETTAFVIANPSNETQFSQPTRQYGEPRRPKQHQLDEPLATEFTYYKPSSVPPGFRLAHLQSVSLGNRIDEVVYVLIGPKKAGIFIKQQALPRPSQEGRKPRLLVLGNIEPANLPGADAALVRGGAIGPHGDAGVDAIDSMRLFYARSSTLITVLGLGVSQEELYAAASSIFG